MQQKNVLSPRAADVQEHPLPPTLPPPKKKKRKEKSFLMPCEFSWSMSPHNDVGKEHNIL